MRITGGDLAGRTVACPPGVIRPSMDRMRESVFSILGDLTGFSFLDLFSGSGVIALEALSRGAEDVTAVERDSKKRIVMLENFSLSPVQPRLIIAPVERFVATCRETYDVVFLDPPFDYRFKADLIERIAERQIVAPRGRLMIHYPKPETLPERAGTLAATDERKYGRSHVRRYDCAER